MTDSRAKGQRGERELFALLSDRLGYVVRRINATYARKGDPDSLELPGWACEVKRVEEWRNAYWAQAVEQAEQLGRKPVLFWRQSRKPWQVMLDAADVRPETRRGRYVVTISIDFFCEIVREGI